jgi:hypothetical protein
MTVARGLVELKTLDKRITKATGALELVKVRRKDDKWDVAEFSRKARTDLQSLLDLIDRRDLLKRKIIQSNAMTKVTIDGREYSIAEVIDRKQTLRYRRALLDHLRVQRQTAEKLNERLMEEVRTRLHSLIERDFAKDSKTSPDNISSIGKAYLQANQTELLDPVSLDKVLGNLEDAIERFEKEADLILSESNALTKIDVVPAPLTTPENPRVTAAPVDEGWGAETTGEWGIEPATPSSWG